MTNLLINEPPLQVLPSLAVKVGVTEAIILQQIHWWLLPSKKPHYIDGRPWIYNTYEQWHEQFPFWHKDTIKRAITSLEKQGFLISANHNKDKQIRTKWYTINYEAFEEKTPSNPCSSSSVQNAPMGGDAPMLSANCTDGNGKMPQSYKEQKNTSLDSSSRQRAPDKKNRGEEERIHEWILEVIPEAKRMSMAPTKNWLNSGARFEDDIKPVITRDYQKLKDSGEELGSLEFFTRHILNQTKRRLKPRVQAESIETAKVIDFKPEEIREFKESQGLSWRDVCEKLKDSPYVGQAKFNSWIAPLEPESFLAGQVTLKAPSAFERQYVSLHLAETIRMACRQISQSVREVRIV